MFPIKHEIKKVVTFVDERGSIGRAEGGYGHFGNVLDFNWMLFGFDSVNCSYLFTCLSVAKKVLKE